MKTLNTYVTKEFITTAGLAVFVLTFIMLGWYMITIFSLISKGFPVEMLLLLMLYISPKILIYSIPMSTLVATMLVFGRMSADNEITAMRACGISIMQIISPIVVLTFLMTCLCLYLQLELTPQYYGKFRDVTHDARDVIQKDPMALIEPGEHIPFDNYHIYVQEKTADELRGIQMFEVTKDGTKVKSDITAKRGTMSADQQKQILTITLYNATIVSYDVDGAKRIYNDKFIYKIPYGEEFNKTRSKEKTKFLTLKELFARTLFYRKFQRDTTVLEVELNQRLAMGLSPIALLLLGLPLAIRTSRRETMVGLALSVVLAGVYLLSIVVFSAFSKYPQYHPQFLLWIPNIIYQVVGIIFLYRITRK